MNSKTFITILALAACVAGDQRRGPPIRHRIVFMVGAPTVIDVDGLNCGPQSGGVDLVIHGTGWNATTDIEVAIGHRPVNGSQDEWVQCTVLERDDRHVVCRTGRATGPSQSPGHLVVRFDEALVVPAPGFEFSYVADPEIVPDQMLWGIRSGGTHVPVALRSRWQCVDSVTFYVEESGGTRTYGDGFCGFRSGPDATTMNCPAPVLWPTVENQPFPCGFDVQLAGQPFNVPCTPSSTYYYVAANPAFTHFNVLFALDIDRIVFVIHGSGLGSGFLVDDVSVLFRVPNSPEDVLCDVALMTADRIECLPPAEIDTVQVNELFVSVGNALTTVDRQSDDNRRAL